MKKVFFIALGAALNSQICISQTRIAPKEATQATINVNQKIYSELPFSDRQDYEDVKKGLIAPLPDGIIKTLEGRVVWNMNLYNFLNKEETPNTINPSAWRISQLNNESGLFKVTDKIYQIRGFDLSNMSIIEGKTGLIIIDPLVSAECAKAGLELFNKNISKKSVVAVIYTHSHVDHYGGVRGVIDEKDVKSGKVKVIAPEGFLTEAISENLYAGNAMLRRGLYMYGQLIEPSEKGQIDGGLGKRSSNGTTGLIPPTVYVKKTGEKMTVDGIDIVFQMAPGTEAPAEMLMYFPQYKALCAAEDCTHTLHNLLTLRGAQVRDAQKWWQTLDETIKTFSKDAEVMFAQHHWPTWGNEKITGMLENQRDMYKYLNDRTLHLINQGYSAIEIGEMMTLPKNLSNKFYNRGYYGSVNHNVKAIYQRYLGFYSGNPADLYQLPEVDAAKKFVEYAGGADALITKAQKDYANGEYRWVAQVMNKVVFADPNNIIAKQLEADALEQMGYQAENPIWRNIFLTGASELRNGKLNIPVVNLMGIEVLKALSWEMIFDYMSIRLNNEKAEGKSYAFNIVVNSTKDKYVLKLENNVLIYHKDEQASNADATITMDDKLSFYELLDGKTKIDDQIKQGKLKITGDKEKVDDLFKIQDNFELMFNIVTP